MLDLRNRNPLLRNTSDPNLDTSYPNPNPRPDPDWYKQLMGKSFDQLLQESNDRNKQWSDLNAQGNQYDTIGGGGVDLNSGNYKGLSEAGLLNALHALGNSPEGWKLQKTLLQKYGSQDALNKAINLYANGSGGNNGGIDYDFWQKLGTQSYYDANPGAGSPPNWTNPPSTRAPGGPDVPTPNVGAPNVGIDPSKLWRDTSGFANPPPNPPDLFAGGSPGGTPSTPATGTMPGSPTTPPTVTNTGYSGQGSASSAINNMMQGTVGNTDLNNLGQIGQGVLGSTGLSNNTRRYIATGGPSTNTNIGLDQPTYNPGTNSTKLYRYRVNPAYYQR